MAKPFIGMKATVMKSTMGGALRHKLTEINTPVNVTGYNVGWPKSSRYTREDGSTIGTGRIAMFLEFGFGNIRTGTVVPERPFFRSANKKFRPTLLKELRIAASNIRSRPSTASLNRIGAAHANRVRQSILRGDYEPYTKNAESTTRIKGHDHALIHTNQMADDVTHEITRKI